MSRYGPVGGARMYVFYDGQICPEYHRAAVSADQRIVFRPSPTSPRAAAAEDVQNDRRAPPLDSLASGRTTSLTQEVPAVPNTLQEMIKKKLDHKGWSYSDVARRGGISRSTVHHLATSAQLAQMPQRATLEGLARGLGVPVAPVLRAAAEAAGINVYFENTPEIADPEVEILVASVQKLSPTDRRHVAALVESLLQAGGS